MRGHEKLGVAGGTGLHNQVQQGQLGYVDQVSISHILGGSYLASYDFEFQAMGIPTTSEWGLITLVLLLLATSIWLSRRRRLA